MKSIYENSRAKITMNAKEQIPTTHPRQESDKAGHPCFFQHSRGSRLNGERRGKPPNQRMFTDDAEKVEKLGKTLKCDLKIEVKFNSFRVPIPIQKTQFYFYILVTNNRKLKL